MLTLALALAALACEGDARRVQRVTELDDGVPLEQHLRVREPFDLAASRISERLLRTRNPAAGWQVAYPRWGPRNLPTQVIKRQTNLDRQVEMSSQVETANTQSTSELEVVEKEYRDQMLTVLLKSAVPELLLKEPQIECFADDIKVMDRALDSGGVSLRGVQATLLMLKLLRSMRDRFIMKDDFQVLGFNDMEEFTRSTFPRTAFSTRWKVQLEGVQPAALLTPKLLGLWKTPIELDANMSFHLNEDKQIDSVTIQQVSINGGKPLSSWPDVSLPYAEIASLEAQKDALNAKIKSLTAEVDALRELLRESQADRRKSKDEFADKLKAANQALDIVNKTVLDLSPLLGQGEFGGLIDNSPAQEALSLLHNTYSSFDNTRQVTEETESSEQFEFESLRERTTSGIQSTAEALEIAKQSFGTIENKLAIAKEFPTVSLELQKIEEWAERIREKLEEEALVEEKEQKERKAREEEEERKRKAEEKVRKAEERERQLMEEQEERERKAEERKQERERKEAEAKELRQKLADAAKAEKEEQAEAARKEMEERLALKAEKKEKEEKMRAAQLEEQRLMKQRTEQFKKDQQARKQKLAAERRKQWRALTAEERKQQKVLEKKQKDLARTRLNKWKGIRKQLKGEKDEEEAAAEVETAEVVEEVVEEVPEEGAEEDEENVEITEEKVKEDMAVLKADIQNILRQEPHWNLFSKNFKVLDKDRRLLDGLEDGIRFWKLLRRMDGKFSNEDIQVDSPRLWFFGFPLKKFTASGSVQFTPGFWRRSSVNFELELKFHFDERQKIDYVSVERWLADGQVLETRPEIDLAGDVAENVKIIEAWALELV